MRERGFDRQMDGLLDAVWDAGGTDLLLTAGTPPQIRVRGELRPLDAYPSLLGEDTERILEELLLEARTTRFTHRRECDFSFSWRDRARVRGSAFMQRDMTTVALRMIPRVMPTMGELDLPPVVSHFARQQQGFVLVTGPTGSGKSTTLAAVIDRINTERSCHILTIEDPIEYLHEHKRSTVSQREVGTDTASFSDALRAALRADPDVLLVGEMRDLESIRFALTIAETGHLVLATLHTNDTSQAIARIIDAFPAEQQSQVRVQLAAALTGIVYQRLIPRIDGGLVAAYEVLVATPAVRNLVREGKTNQLRNALVTGQREGMLTLEQSLSTLISKGLITYEDATSRSLYPKDIDQRPVGSS
jgi:twitching motility protein PilT